MPPFGVGFGRGTCQRGRVTPGSGEVLVMEGVGRSEFLLEWGVGRTLGRDWGPLTCTEAKRGIM